MYIITNRTPDGEYAPSATNSKKEAIEWLRECSINNYVAAYGPIVFGKLTLVGEAYNELKKVGLVDDFIRYVNNDKSGSRIDEDNSIIWYLDESYNNMTIYEMPGKLVV